MQNNLNSWFEQGLNFHQAGRLADAMGAYRRVLTENPNHPECLYNLGLILQETNQPDAAIAAYRRAIELQPGFAEAYNNLGNIYNHLNRLDEAGRMLGRALEISPGLVQARFNLARVLQKQGRLEPAVTQYRTILEAVPNHAEAFDSLCSLLIALGRVEEWLQAFEQFEQVEPKPDWFFISGLYACRYLGDFERERKYLQAMFEYPFNNGDLGMLSGVLCLAQFFDLPQEQIFRLYRAYNQTMMRRIASVPPLTFPDPTPHQKLRIGYLSADLRDHVMGKMIYQAISRHDTSRFEVYCYSLSTKEDKWTEKFRDHCHKFLGIAGMTPRAAAEVIAADELDILVDLSSHTKGARPEILAYKPARVQMTHIANTMAVGLETIDFKLTDQYSDTPENQSYMLERLLPMQGCIFPYYRMTPAEQHEYHRDKLGIARETIVLGAYVNLMKLGQRCLALWRQVLERLPTAVLAFSPTGNSEQSQLPYLRLLEAAGIPSERAIFIPSGANEGEMLARYAIVDMVLDTLPCGGVNGTLEALGMGVPVVTLCGERFGERTSYSILMNLGVEQTIASTEAGFVDIACRLANDPEWRNMIVQKIREGMSDSVLVDMDRYTRNLEQAYQRAISLVTADQRQAQGRP